MNTRPIAALGIVFLVLTLVGCAGGAPRPAMISHVVFVELADPADAPAVIADCDAKLSTIPGVVSYAAGPPLDTGRASVLADYHVGIYIGFDSEEDYAHYVDHPDHIGLVAKWKPRITALRVHDFVDVSP